MKLICLKENGTILGLEGMTIEPHLRDHVITVEYHGSLPMSIFSGRYRLVDGQILSKNKGE